MRKSREAVAREVVAVAPDDRQVGKIAAELCGHAFAGLDGDDVGAAGVQEGGRHAGAGACVRDPCAGEGAACELLDRVEEGGRVRGTVGRVLGRGHVEGVGSGGVGWGAGRGCHGAIVAGAGWGGN